MPPEAQENTTDQLLDVIIEQNERNNPIPSLDNIVESQEETRKTIEDGNEVVVMALNNLKPALEKVTDTAEALNSFVGVLMQAANKGEKGEPGRDGRDGYTPRKGVDYDDGKDGKDGKDGVDGKDGRDGRDGKDGVGEKGVDGKDGKDGKNGKDGKDGSPDSGKDIVKKLTDLPEDERLSFDSLKDKPLFRQQASKDYAFTELTDTPSSYRGKANKVVSVKADESGLEFTANSPTGGLQDPGANGIVVRTALDTTTARTITAGSTKVGITNGSGVAGNPTIDVNEANLDLANMGGTLDIANGGTGQTTQTAAFNALDPLTTKGDIIVNDGTNSVRLPVGTDGQVLTADSAQTDGLKWATPAASVTEVISEYLVPETPIATQSTRAGATTLQGASYIVHRDITFNRIIIRCQTSAGVGTTIAVAIYQKSDGTSGNTVTKVATCTGVVTVGGTNLIMTPSEGSVTLKTGLCYVVWGRDSVGGSFTMRTHTVQNYDLLTANVDTDTHPTAFTTTISATALPASIDVRLPATGNLTPTTTDVPLVVVLKKV